MITYIFIGSVVGALVALVILWIAYIQAGKKTERLQKDYEYNMWKFGQTMYHQGVNDLKEAVLKDRVKDHVNGQAEG